MALLEGLINLGLKFDEVSWQPLLHHLRYVLKKRITASSSMPVPCTFDYKFAYYNTM